MTRALHPAHAALPLALLLVFGPLGASAWPQTAAATGSLPAGSVIEYHPQAQTLTVHVSGLPLRQLLDEISKQTHIHFRPPAPAQEFDNRLVTRSFDQMPLERAIKQVLGPSNTAMIYDSRRTAGGREAQPVLAEVRVLGLGVIPIIASPATADNGGEQPATFHRNPAKVDENQSIRAAKQEKRAEKNQSRGGGGGRGGGNAATNQNQSKTSTDQSSSGSGSSKSSNKSK